jgi:1-acyl-sn-glycerol-3-phosphate acyltransferase
VHAEKRTEKPRTKTYRPDLVRLPELSRARLLIRRFLRCFCRLLVRLLFKYEVSGLEHFPAKGPVLIVTNHLGDADGVFGLAFFPERVEALAKVELYDIPALGWVLDAYGAIWLHRGSPDRRAVRAALDGLAEGRFIAIAPEGRESLTGSLEEGTEGAAYLALKSEAPLIPVTFTGTENKRVLNNLLRLRRTHATMTVGPAFTLTSSSDWRKAITKGTQQIMLTLARQLPPEYRGVYREYVE